MAEPERERPSEDALDDPDAPTDDSLDAEATDAETADAETADADAADADAEVERDDAHLRDVEPGAGCTEIWEHLSENRDD